MTGAPTGRWIWIVRCPDRSNGPRLGWSGKLQRWVGCIIIMRGEQQNVLYTDVPFNGATSFRDPQVPQSPVLWAVESCPPSSPAATPAVAGGPRTARTSGVSRPGEPAGRLQLSFPP